MKKITLLSILLGCMFLSIAQPPQSFNYQAVVRDNDGNVLPFEDVILRTSIIQGLPGGSIIYQEVHTTATDKFGRVSLAIGEGESSIGNFSTIDWDDGIKSLKVELMLESVGSYTVVGTTEIKSVPFALNAANAYWDRDGNNIAYMDGNVGIGIQNPVSKFQVSGAVSGGLLANPSYGVYGAHLTGSQGYLAGNDIGAYGKSTPGIGVKGSTQIGKAIYGEVTGDGFGGYFEGKSYFQNAVGIGTTDPSAELEVLGEVHAYSFHGDGSALTGTGDNLGNHTATQNIKLNGKYLSGDGGNEGVYVTDAGTVGIGTNAPGEDHLSVQGNISLSGEHGAFLRFRQSNDMRWSFLYRDWTPSSFCLWEEVEGKLVMGFKQETGHVGIGCNASNMLDVQGAGTETFGVAGYNEVVGHFKSTASGHSAVSIDANADRDAIVYLAENGNPLWSIRTDVSDSDNSLEIREHKDGLNNTALRLRNFNVKYVLHMDGDIWPSESESFYLGQPVHAWLNIYSKNFTTVSSKNQLLSSSEIKPGLQEVLLLQPLEIMQSTNNSTEMSFGLDPQATLPIIPEAVYIDEESEDIWGIKYDQLIPVLIRAIQEQQERIEALESKMAALGK